MCVCVRRCLCLAGLPVVILLVFWVGGLFQERSTGTLYQRTHTHTFTHAQRETGNHTNAAQQRVEPAGVFFQMCDINLVDPKHEPVAPTQSSPFSMCVCVSAAGGVAALDLIF